jgi:hypothetical protein
LSGMPTTRTLEISICDYECDLGDEGSAAITDHVLTTGHTVTRVFQLLEEWSPESVAERELKKALRRQGRVKGRA